MGNVVEQMKNAEQVYKQMLDSFLNEIDQVDQNTPWLNEAPAWWADMKDIERLITNKRKKI